MKTPKEVMEERLERAYVGHPWYMEMPDISCKKCGREIYCGVNKLCSDPECEEKKLVRNQNDNSC